MKTAPVRSTTSARPSSRAFSVGPLQAWFDHPEASVYARRLSSDVRASATGGTWSIQVETPQSPLGAVGEGAPVTLSWDPLVQGVGTCVQRTVQIQGCPLASVRGM